MNDNREKKTMDHVLISMRDGVLFVGDQSMEGLMKAVDTFMETNDVDVVSGIAALASISALVAAGYDIDVATDEIAAGKKAVETYPFALHATPAFFNAAYSLAMKAAKGNLGTIAGLTIFQSGRTDPGSETKQ